MKANSATIYPTLQLVLSQMFADLTYTAIYRVPGFLYYDYSMDPIYKSSDSVATEWFFPLYSIQ
jgi:hypothetical protein